MTHLHLSDRIKLHLARPHFTRGRGLYRFGGSDESCDIAFWGTSFAVIEEITRSSNQVRIGHFSVNDPFRSCSVGEACLRTFAARIKALDRSVNSITFDLFRAPTNVDHVKIGQARAALLTKIGVSNVSTATVGPVGNERVEVKGLWHRDDW